MRARSKTRVLESTPTRAAPAYRPEPDVNSRTPDLFGIVAVVDVDSLLERVKQLGADVYCEGEFPTLSARLRCVIVREQLATTVSGRAPGGKVETVAQAFERVCGELFVPKKVPRGTDKT